MTAASDPRPIIICVDDEPNVLEGLSLTLRRRYDVRTATSGGEALRLLEALPTPAVVISDMRMPGMDGAALLRRARQVAPDTVRMLLTGHADVDSAASAVNEGQIFRFLTKPCHPSTLLAAMESALEQHRLITAERVLLEQTLQGSVKALIDVLALTSPVAFGRAIRIKNYVSDLASHLEIRERWQVEMAAMLSQLGCIVLPSDTADKLHTGADLSESEQAMVARMPTVLEQLLANIPRLEAVRAILATYQRPYVAIAATSSAEDTLVRRGAHLLRIASDFDLFDAKGGTPALALDRIRGRALAYDPVLVEALNAILAVRDSQPRDIRQVSVASLRVGMVLAEDVRGEGGLLVAARGYEVTPGFIERLSNSRGSVGAKYLVLIPEGHVAAASV